MKDEGLRMRVVEVGEELRQPSELLLVVAIAPRYSISVEEQTNIVYFLVYQEIRLLPD